MKYRGNQLAKRTWMVRALSFSAVAALALNPVLAADEPVAAPVGEQAPIVSPVTTVGSTKVRFLALGIGKSVIIDLPREVKDVLVADPKIANAVVRSAQRAYIIGAAVGQTNVVFFDAAGQQVAAYDIAVKRDLNGVRAALRHTLPGIQIEGVGDGVMLTGSVSSPIEAQQAGDLRHGVPHGTAQGAGWGGTAGQYWFRWFRRVDHGLHHRGRGCEMQVATE